MGLFTRNSNTDSAMAATTKPSAKGGIFASKGGELTPAEIAANNALASAETVVSAAMKAENITAPGANGAGADVPGHTTPTSGPGIPRSVASTPIWTAAATAPRVANTAPSERNTKFEDLKLRIHQQLVERLASARRGARRGAHPCARAVPVREGIAQQLRAGSPHG
jgi:hypothetical protein